MVYVLPRTSNFSSRVTLDFTISTATEPAPAMGKFCDAHHLIENSKRFLMVYTSGGASSSPSRYPVVSPRCDAETYPRLGDRGTVPLSVTRALSPGNNKGPVPWQRQGAGPLPA